MAAGQERSSDSDGERAASPSAVWNYVGGALVVGAIVVVLVITLRGKFEPRAVDSLLPTDPDLQAEIEKENIEREEQVSYHPLDAESDGAIEIWASGVVDVSDVASEEDERALAKRVFEVLRALRESTPDAYIELLERDPHRTLKTGLLKDNPNLLRAHTWAFESEPPDDLSLEDAIRDLWSTDVATRGRVTEIGVGNRGARFWVANAYQEANGRYVGPLDTLSSEERKYWYGTAISTPLTKISVLDQDLKEIVTEFGDQVAADAAIICKDTLGRQFTVFMGFYKHPDGSGWALYNIFLRGVHARQMQY